MGKAFVAIDHIKALNVFRLDQKGNSFTKETLKEALKNGGIPSNELFVSHLRKSPVLTQVGKNQFKFATDKPVYWGLLDRVYKDYKITLRRYDDNKKQREKQAQEAKVAV